MKMYDFVVLFFGCFFFFFGGGCFVFFFALKHRSRVHISELAGLCRTCRVPKNVFLAVVAGNVTT